MNVKRPHSKLEESLLIKSSSIASTSMSIKRPHSKLQEEFHGKFSSIVSTSMGVKRLHSKFQEKFHGKPSSTPTHMSVRRNFMEGLHQLLLLL